ncbi:2'-5'-oligoadenylate synthase 1A-like [Glandiceps talaboti]
MPPSKEQMPILACNCCLVNSVCISLHEYHIISSRRVLSLTYIFFHSGSFGKGTQVRGHADLDSVLVLNDFSDVDDRIARGPEVMKTLATQLKAKDWVMNVSWDYYYYTMTFAMQREDGVSMAVDLLPTFEVLGQNPSNDKIEETYQTMFGLSRRQVNYYSVPLCQLQLEFVRKQPTRAKTLIRLVKYWRKTEVEKKKKKATLRYPNSYSMELITIHVWEEAVKPRRINLAGAFKAVLRQLVNYKHLDVEWYDYYSPEIADQARWETERPILLDPANPTNNIMATFKPEAWDDLATIAAESMRRPLLRNVVIPGFW